MFRFLHFEITIEDSKVSTSVYQSLHESVLAFSWTYSVISWWCWMHEFSRAFRSHLAIVWTCSSSCPWWIV